MAAETVDTYTFTPATRSFFSADEKTPKKVNTNLENLEPVSVGEEK